MSNPHYGQADELIQTELAATGGSYLDPQTTALAIAGVQATLALAYAQDTANLIAYQANVERSYHHTLTRHRSGQANALNRQIIERLGLE